MFPGPELLGHYPGVAECGPMKSPEELSTRNSCRAVEQPADSEGREPPALLQSTEDGPLPEVDLIGKT